VPPKPVCRKRIYLDILKKSYISIKTDELCAAVTEDQSRDMLQYVQQDLQMQTIRNIKIEAQSRRSNIKFFGVREAEAESNPYETERIVKLLLQNAEGRRGEFKIRKSTPHVN